MGERTKLKLLEKLIYLEQTMSQIKKRKLNRLKDYDYYQDGFYFVTICTKNREEIFGKIDDGKMILNEYGEIAKNCWLDLPNHYQNCVLDEFIVMTNHVHGIIIIENNIGIPVVGNGLKPFPTKPFPTKNHGLSEIIRGFKTFSAKYINLKSGEKIFQWQKSFYDHIIRNEISLNNIRDYIINNPLKWDLDENILENFTN